MWISVKVARCLAAVTSPPWEKVDQQLWRDCPQPRPEGLVLTNRDQQAILALGIFYLESGFLHQDKILDYLLTVERGLATASFPDELPSDRRSKLPPAEIFAFTLTTLLNDIASHNPEVMERILETQLDLLTTMIGQLQQMKQQDKPSAFSTRKWTCKCLLPALLGLCRAMARFSPPDGDFLISKIFPCGGGRGGGRAGTEEATDKMKGYTNFR